MKAQDQVVKQPRSKNVKAPETKRQGRATLTVRVSRKVPG